MNQEFVNGQRTVFCGAAKRGASGEWAFTLIELLTVIAIIGVLAGLVVGLSGLATAKSREARIRGEHARLITGIESYKAEMNAYPQDNQRSDWLTPPETEDNLHKRAGHNLLYYELTGAVFRTNGGPSFAPIGRNAANEAVSATALRTVFGVGGIENSARVEREVPYRQFKFKPDQYRALDTPAGTNVNILVVPLKGPHEYDALGPGTTRIKVNPWFYDSSSTNRHNAESYDLWSEYLTGRGTNVRVIKNWITTTRPGIPSND